MFASLAVIYKHAHACILFFCEILSHQFQNKFHIYYGMHSNCDEQCWWIQYSMHRLAHMCGCNDRLFVEQMNVAVIKSARAFAQTTVDTSGPKGDKQQSDIRILNMGLLRIQNKKKITVTKPFHSTTFSFQCIEIVEVLFLFHFIFFSLKYFTK